MAQSTHTPEVPKYGQPAPIARLFLNWFMIAALGAFLINNVLIVAYEMPTAMAFLSDGFSLNGMVTPAVYLIAFMIAAYYVLMNPDNALARYDAADFIGLTPLLCGQCSGRFSLLDWQMPLWRSCALKISLSRGLAKNRPVHLDVVHLLPPTCTCQ